MNFYSRLLAAPIVAAIVFIQPQNVSALMVDEVNSIAEEITVLIPLKNPKTGKNENGSGAIIAKEENTYTVLTANHVACSDRPLTEVCQTLYEIKVVTHDGQEYKVENSTVKKIPGVDLAVFKFTSDKNYKLAKLANYDHSLISEKNLRRPNGEIVSEYGQFVFASGWPGINGRDIQKLAYRFSIGKLLPSDKMVGFKIRPIEEGYEAVYTSITYPGMSGGPVLDTDGRVIAIHGQNEGETVKVEESSGKKNRRVQIGYSLSIPISKFLTLAPQAGIQLSLKLESNPPATLTEDEIDSIGTQYLLSWLEDPSEPASNTAVFWANKGNQYWRALQPETAIEAYDKALEIDPYFYPVWYGKGLIKAFRNEYAEALEAYNKALQIIDKKIGENSQETELPKIRGFVQNLRAKIQPFLVNSQSPNGNSATPAMPIAPFGESPTPGVQPSPAIKEPDPVTTPNSSAPKPLW